MTQLAPKFFQPAEVMRNQWHVKPEYGTPPEALRDPSYWAHVSAQLRPGDVIYAMPDDKSYFSELLVIDAGKLFAKVCELRCVKLTASQVLNVKVPDGYEIKFRGPRKWSVLRGDDVLKEDMEKQQAEQWLTDHVKAA